MLLPEFRDFRARVPRGRDDAGVTLVELLITMVLFGILIGIVAAPYAGYRLTQQHIGTTRELVGFLRRTQVRAVAEETPYRVDFATDGKSATVYRVTNWTSGSCTAGTSTAAQTVRTMTARITYTSVSFLQPCGGTARSVWFYPRGSAGKGSVVVSRSGSSKTYKVDVEGLTARVSYQ